MVSVVLSWLPSLSEELGLGAGLDACVGVELGVDESLHPARPPMAMIATAAEDAIWALLFRRVFISVRTAPSADGFTVQANYVVNRGGDAYVS